MHLQLQLRFSKRYTHSFLVKNNFQSRDGLDRSCWIGFLVGCVVRRRRGLGVVHVLRSGPRRRVEAVGALDAERRGSADGRPAVEAGNLPPGRAREQLGEGPRGADLVSLSGVVRVREHRCTSAGSWRSDLGLAYISRSMIARPA
jgi:hypothetical protein